MSKTSPAARLALGIGHGSAGIGFFFSIVGVFGLSAAICSLILFIVIAVVSSFQTVNPES
jgi:hypothetical protein